MAAFEIFRIHEDGLYDFKPFILSNVFEQLMQLDDFETQMVLCIGVVTDGKSVGALVAQLLTGNEIFLHSIMVAPAYRRRGMGRALIESVLSEAGVVFAEEYSIPAMPFRVLLRTDYAMPEESILVFEDFLKAVGFGDFLKKETVACISGKRLDNRWFDAADHSGELKITSFSRQADGFAEEVSGFWMNRGISLSTDHAFMSISGDEPKTILAAEYGMDNEYNLLSVTDDDADIPEEEYLELLKNILRSLKEENPDFLLIADGHTNINAKTLMQLAREAGTVYLHREAGFYGEFNTETE